MDETSPPEGKRRGPRPKPMRPAKPQFQTRAGNAASVIAAVDGRSMIARRYREIAANLVSDIGGDPSEAQKGLIQRATNLMIWCEHAENEMAAGGKFDIAAYCTTANTLRRFLADLGLERRTKDVTDLRSYISQARDAE